MPDTHTLSASAYAQAFLLFRRTENDDRVKVVFITKNMLNKLYFALRAP